MPFKFTLGQKQRLIELGASWESVGGNFETLAEREHRFNRLVRFLTKENLKILRDYLDKGGGLLTGRVEEKLRNAALSMGFSEVRTPIIISKFFIERMGIKEGNPLWKQIIWTDEKHCLRPMLAPGLYTLMSKLSRLRKVVKIFEVGPCFRRDTRGPLHLKEFTMFNLVELAPNGNMQKLRKNIKILMEAVGLKNYKITREYSEVYGETLDVKVGAVEVASAAIGPKPIDENWGICNPWIGVGFGVERLAMLIGGYNSVARVSRSLIYINGARLDVK